MAKKQIKLTMSDGTSVLSDPFELTDDTLQAEVDDLKSKIKTPYTRTISWSDIDQSVSPPWNIVIPKSVHGQGDFPSVDIYLSDTQAGGEQWKKLYGSDFIIVSGGIDAGKVSFTFPPSTASTSLYKIVISAGMGIQGAQGVPGQKGADGSGEVVELAASTTSTSGTITDAQLSKLQERNDNYILFSSKIYRLADKQAQRPNYLVYSYLAQNSSGVFVLETVTIQTSLKTWFWSSKKIGSFHANECERNGMSSFSLPSWVTASTPFGFAVQCMWSDGNYDAGWTTVGAFSGSGNIRPEDRTVFAIKSTDNSVQLVTCTITPSIVDSEPLSLSFDIELSGFPGTSVSTPHCAIWGQDL